MPHDRWDKGLRRINEKRRKEKSYFKDNDNNNSARACSNAFAEPVITYFVVYDMKGEIYACI
jgi:hypothetical protein